MPDITLTAAQAAAVIGRPSSWVRSLCHAGKIPGAHQNGLGHWQIPAQAVADIPCEAEVWRDWPTADLELLGTDTDARVGAILDRSGEAVRDMRSRQDIAPYPSWAPPEEQIPRMTTERLQNLQQLIGEELSARAGT